MRSQMTVFKSIGVAFASLFIVGAYQPAQADKYFACGGSIGGRQIQLQIKNDAVRCYAPAGYIHSDVGNCLPGQAYRIDYTGNADKCVTGIGTAAIAADPPCNSGHSLDRRSGKDRCRKPQAEYIRAPTNEVNR